MRQAFSGILCACLTLQLVVCSASLKGLVICIGADGHLAVEAAGADCCENPDAASVPGPDLRSGDPDGDCGDCRDIPCLTSVDTRLAKRSSSKSAGAPGDFHALIADPTPPPSAHRTPDRMPTPGDLEKTPHSVPRPDVLLI